MPAGEAPVAALLRHDAAPVPRLGRPPRGVIWRIIARPRAIVVTSAAIREAQFTFPHEAAPECLRFAAIFRLRRPQPADALAAPLVLGDALGESMPHDGPYFLGFLGG